MNSAAVLHRGVPHFFLRLYDDALIMMIELVPIAYHYTHSDDVTFVWTGYSQS
jgi:hypothetical protein